MGSEIKEIIFFYMCFGGAVLSFGFFTKSWNEDRGLRK